MKRLFAILILIIMPLAVVRAQFGVEQPFFALASTAAASGPFGPTNVAGLGNWWVFSDVVTNAAVSNWVDRIQFKALTNSGTARPTNSALGVHFVEASSTQLTNSGVPIGDNDGTKKHTQWYIINLDNASGFHAFVGTSPAAARQNHLGFDFGKNYFFITPTLYESGAIAAGAWVDVCLVGGSGNTSTWYTNGVASTTVANSLDNGINWRCWGGDGLNGFCSVFVREYAIFTNTVLSASSVSNLHYYATNLYKYTP